MTKQKLSPFNDDEIEALKNLLEENDFDDSDLEKMRTLRTKSEIDSISFGILFFLGYSFIRLNINLLNGNEGLKNRMIKFLYEFKRVEELRELVENYGDGTGFGTYYIGENIRDYVRKNREKMNKLTQLFFNVYLTEEM